MINDVECVEMKCSRAGCGYLVTVFSEHSSIQGALSWLDYEEEAEHNHEFDGSDMTKADKDKMDKVERRRKKLRREEEKETQKELHKQELHKQELHKDNGHKNSLVAPESPLFLLSEEELPSSPVLRAPSSESEIEVTDVVLKPKLKKTKSKKQDKTTSNGDREKRTADLESPRKSTLNGTTQDIPTRKTSQKNAKNGSEQNGSPSSAKKVPVTYISLDSDSDTDTEIILAPKRRAPALLSPTTPKKQKTSSTQSRDTPSQSRDKAHDLKCKFCSRAITATSNSTQDDVEHALMTHIQLVHPREVGSHVTKQNASHVGEYYSHVTSDGNVSDDDLFFEAEEGDDEGIGHVTNTSGHVPDSQMTDHVTEDNPLTPLEVGEPEQAQDMVSRDPRSSQSHDLLSRDVVTIIDSSSDPEYAMSEEVEQISDLESAPESEADRIKNAIRNAAKKVIKTSHGNYGATKMAQRVIANGTSKKTDARETARASTVPSTDTGDTPTAPVSARAATVTPTHTGDTTTTARAPKASPKATTSTATTTAPVFVTKAVVPSTVTKAATVGTTDTVSSVIAATAPASTVPTIDAICGVSSVPTVSTSKTPTMTSRAPASGITHTALAAAHTAPSTGTLVPSATGQMRPMTTRVESHVPESHVPHLTQQHALPLTQQHAPPANPALALQQRVREQVEQHVLQSTPQPMTNQLSQHGSHVTANHVTQDLAESAKSALHTRYLLTNQTHHVTPSTPSPDPPLALSQSISNYDAYNLSLHLKNSRKWHSVFSLRHRGTGVSFLCYAHLLGIKLAQYYPEVVMVDRVDSAIEVGGVDATGSYFPILFAHDLGRKRCTEAVFEWLKFVYSKNRISDPHVIVSSYNLGDQVQDVFPNTAVIRNRQQVDARVKSETPDIFNDWMALLAGEERRVQDISLLSWLDKNAKTLLPIYIDKYMHFGHVRLVPGVLRSLQKVEKDVMLAFKQNESQMMGFYSRAIVQQRYERANECVHSSKLTGIVSHKALEYINHALHASKLACKGGGWPHDVSKCEKQATGMPCPILLIFLKQTSSEMLSQFVHSHWHLMTEAQIMEEVGEATSQIVYPEHARETEVGWKFA